MHLCRLPLVATSVLSLSILLGCGSVPQNGALLNEKVSEGIRRNQLENEKIIKALADTQRVLLDEKWEEIYSKVEDAYIKKNLLDSAKLTKDHRANIAALAGQVRAELMGKIKEIETSLVTKSRANSNQLVALNSEVSKYLASLRDLDDAENSLQQGILGIVGLDGFVEDLKSAGKKVTDVTATPE